MNTTPSISKILSFLSVLVLLVPSLSFAQILNQQIDALLASNCAGLGTNGPGLGANLSQLCAFPTTTGAASSGGGAASVQGSAASIFNRMLLDRLDDVQQEGQSGDKKSSMRFNPLGLLALTHAGPMSINSPFYASSSSMGSPTAGFMASSPTRWNGLGFFATGRVESLNRDITTFQDGYKSTIFGVLAGLDYRFSKSVVAGMLGTYSNTDGDFRGGGTFSTNSYGWLAFAQILPTERTFIHVTGGYTRNNYLVNRLATARITEPSLPTPPFERSFSGFASSHSNGDVVNAGILAGYDHPIGRFVVGPRAGVNYTRTHIGNHTENGGAGLGLAYDDQHIDSLQSSFGLFGSTAYSTALGVLVHQVSADYIHEFMNHQRQINVQFAEDNRGTDATRFTFQNDRPARDYAYLATGLVMVLPNGWQPFLNFRAMVGNDQFNNYTGMLGLRLTL